MDQAEYNSIRKMETYSGWLESEVEKKSGKPFKSRLQVNKVKGILIHPITEKPSFTFYEDDSYVECFRCKLLNTQI